MKNRITELFAKKKNNILNVYFTAGYPALNDTVRIAQLLEKAGADIIEIGIPFSDPVADGPTIQASNKVALDNGMTLHKLLEQVKEIRKHVSLPIILMGYINPVMQYGVEKFAKDASAIGVDGVIIPDLPLHEFEELYKDLFESVNLCNTFLISPTTSEDRIRKIDAVTEGFIYAVSASSITGAKGDFSAEQVAYFERLQNLKLKNPFLIGFGISNHATFSRAASYSTGAIVGSAFINLLRESKDLEADIEQFVQSLRT
ncbi:MAG TPA: tryptophan synthase subunit alpha [Ohtaekwangia sp.]|uniref:tryptophan synthase subunit alpha n=1 Tax=Ohtaekwangia sp. TaxID=2066019 RepID=UPI002F940C0F